MLNAFLSNDWTAITESANKPLEPLELSKLEQSIIIARMKKLAKDPAFYFANALELVHNAYQEQDWERQSEYGDFVRPKPSDQNAWKQYEEMIQNAVQLLSKYRGINGDWRTDRFVTVPTNDRASMGSMAAASIGEGIRITWKSLGSQVLTETAQLSDIDDIKQNMDMTNCSTDDILERLEQYCTKHDLVLAEGDCDETYATMYVYSLEAELIDTIILKNIS